MIGERGRQRPRDHVRLPSRARDRRRARRGRARLLHRPRRHDGASERWDDVEALDGKIDPVLQNELMVGVDTLVEDVARWYLLNAPERARSGRRSRRRAPVFDELADVLDGSARRAGGAPARRSPGLSSRRASPSSWRSDMPSSRSSLTRPDVAAVSPVTGRTDRGGREAHSSSPASASTSTGSSASSWSCPTGLASSAGRARRSATTS